MALSCRSQAMILSGVCNDKICILKRKLKGWTQTDLKDREVYYLTYLQVQREGGSRLGKVGCPHKPDISLFLCSAGWAASRSRDSCLQRAGPVLSHRLPVVGSGKGRRREERGMLFQVQTRTSPSVRWRTSSVHTAGPSRSAITQGPAACWNSAFGV